MDWTLIIAGGALIVAVTSFILEYSMDNTTKTKYSVPAPPAAGGAGAPDWGDPKVEAAISRMADRLMAEISLESGAVEIAGPWQARDLIKSLILAAAAAK